MFDDPAFAQAVDDRWDEVYSQLVASDAFIGAQASIISDSAEANFDRWDITEELEDVQVIKGSWTAEVSYLRTWLKSRIAWMEGQLGD